MLDESESTGHEKKSVITNDIIKGEILTDENLALKLSDLGPFLSRQVTERLKKSLKTKNVASTEDVKQITQPPSIKVGTLRDYQLRGVIPSTISFHNESEIEYRCIILILNSLICGLLPNTGIVASRSL
jgi:hypothetical protein